MRSQLLLRHRLLLLVIATVARPYHLFTASEQVEQALPSPLLCAHHLNVPLPQVPPKSVQPTRSSPGAVESPEEATARAHPADDRQAGPTQREQPGNNRQDRQANGDQPFTSMPARSRQLLKQHLLLRQTQLLRQQSQEKRPKRKLERAFGEVRNGEQTPGQAGSSKAEDDEWGKRQRALVHEQASPSCCTSAHKCDGCVDFAMQGSLDV